jgi:1-acyl-sn-glycerol-3-phosphate acyltransferase
MRVFSFLFFFVIKICYWDLVIRLKHFISPQTSLAFFNDYFKKMTRETFRLVLKITRVRFIVESTPGLQLPEQFIIISNHQSLIDIPLMVYALPRHDIKFVAKDSLGKYIPLISIAIRVGKHALVKRKGGAHQNQKALYQLSRLAQKEKICPLIFPEGTRSKTGAVKSFHTAAIRYLCRYLDLPILTAAIDGGYKLSTLTSFANMSVPVDYRIKLLSLHACPKTKEETLQVIEKSRKDIANQLHIWKTSDNATIALSQKN